MADFDPIRATREELQGLHDVLLAMRRREGAAELAMAQAEIELNSIRKIRGYCQSAVDELREKLRKLEEAANHGGTTG